jgi:hypothetical protein
MEPVIAASGQHPGVAADPRERGAHAASQRRNCVEGITANVEQCRRLVGNSIGMVTALVPVIGYGRATEVAAEALASGKNLADVLRGRGATGWPRASRPSGWRIRSSSASPRGRCGHQPRVRTTAKREPVDGGVLGAQHEVLALGHRLGGRRAASGAGRS